MHIEPESKRSFLPFPLKKAPPEFVYYFVDGLNLCFANFLGAGYIGA
jgi:hypothetical protein